MAKQLAKSVNFHIGVTALGSALSLRANATVQLEVTPNGVIAYSSKHKRTVLVPYSNITGVELIVSTDKPEESSN